MKQNDAKRSIKKKLALACFWCVAVVLILGVGYVPISAAQIAADMSMFSGVTVSPDKTAWTTDYLDKTNERLEKGYTINTGVASTFTTVTFNVEKVV